VRLRRELRELVGEIGATAATWKAFPIRTLTRDATVAAPRAVLVGDAAGVDPLMGEGISFALEYGVLAADAIAAGRARDDLGVGAYVRAVTQGALGRKLRRLALATTLFYGPRRRFWFRVAAASRRAQTIGLAWYNGQGGWDRRSPATALAALVGLRSL
jgi:flavin-dependent dehydrogenase